MIIINYPGLLLYLIYLFKNNIQSIQFKISNYDYNLYNNCMCQKFSILKLLFIYKLLSK